MSNKQFIDPLQEPSVYPSGMFWFFETTDTYQMDLALEDNLNGPPFNAILLAFIGTKEYGAWKTVIVSDAPSWRVIRAHVDVLLEETHHAVQVFFTTAPLLYLSDLTLPGGAEAPTPEE